MALADAFATFQAFYWFSVCDKPLNVGIEESFHFWQIKFHSLNLVDKFEKLEILLLTN